VNMKNKQAKKKSVKSWKSSKSEKDGKPNRNNAKKGSKKHWVKATIFFLIAVFFFAYMFYAGGTINSFFALIIGIVCGLIGALHLK
jgi:hypothetical protein